MKVRFLPIFVRYLNRLDSKLQQEAIEKIELFKDKKNHKQLKVHRLHGRLAGRYSFSVNYKTRVVFCYLSKKEVALLAIGDHAVYDK
ncbi:MAG TPA: hypothetical protein VJK04_01400 [Candidatus Paceibacterota bacterium]